MGDALLLGSCMCCVAFLCCLLLTAGRRGAPKQSLVLKKLVGESTTSKAREALIQMEKWGLS